MSSYPARNHTKRGIAHALGTPLCKHEGPDPCCPCTACQNYRWPESRWESDLTNGAQ